MNCVETIGNNFKLLLKLKFLGFKSLILFLMTCSHIIFFGSPAHYDSMYRRSRSPTPQRLTTEPIPKDRTIFRGPEGTLIDLNELKKITVDIRRNLSRGTVPGPHGPLRYAFDPSDVILVRR